MIYIRNVISEKKTLLPIEIDDCVVHVAKDCPKFYLHFLLQKKGLFSLERYHDFVVEFIYSLNI